ncbi:Peroxide operon regulator [subsurface metagenome]|uniref:Transcriptional repressor n=1 Tax=marine sediment metagenome TaxID=412755 RepID=X0ZIB9_9ZZZZ|nr:transcriptional repressor [Clostridia bacterium]
MKDFKQLLKENNIKVTPQRNLIYRELLNLEGHPSADIVFNKVKKTFPNISYDTVYRTLLTFSKIGIVDIVEGYGEPKRFDTNVNKHHHFRCLNCNKIVDIYEDCFDDLKIPDKVMEKFKVLKSKVILEGICDECDNNG